MERVVFQDRHQVHGTVPERLLPVASISTFGLAFLSMSWACSPGCRSKEHDTNPMKWQAFVGAWLQVSALAHS